MSTPDQPLAATSDDRIGHLGDSPAETPPFETPHLDPADGDAATDLFDGTDAGGLEPSMAALGRLSSATLGLNQLLTRVASLAAQAIPAADGVGLSLLEERRQNTVVATADFVADVDNVQYSLGQGPCISATATGVTVRSGSLGGDQRWPRFGGQVARLGVHSVLSLPLVNDGTVLGSMNVYAYRKQAFDDDAASVGESFAVPAAISVLNAHLLAEAERLVARLQNTISQTAVLERAVGILLSRTGGTAEAALARLRATSQQRHQKLQEIAQSIIDDATSQARALHRRSSDRGSAGSLP